MITITAVKKKRKKSYLKQTKQNIFWEKVAIESKLSYSTILRVRKAIIQTILSQLECTGRCVIENVITFNLTEIKGGIITTNGLKKNLDKRYVNMEDRYGCKVSVSRNFLFMINNGFAFSKKYIPQKKKNSEKNYNDFFVDIMNEVERKYERQRETREKKKNERNNQEGTNPNS